MTKDTVTRLTDDLDGTTDESVTTVQIGWNGEWRELELSEKNRAALGGARQVLERCPAGRQGLQGPGSQGQSARQGVIQRRQAAVDHSRL